MALLPSWKLRVHLLRLLRKNPRQISVPCIRFHPSAVTPLPYRLFTMAAITPSPAANDTKTASTPASPVESTTSQPVGAKRKRTAEPKFYAVKFGFQPGVYHTWNDCLTQVTGFKGAVCRLLYLFFYPNSLLFIYPNIEKFVYNSAIVFTLQCRMLTHLLSPYSPVVSYSG